MHTNPEAHTAEAVEAPAASAPATNAEAPSEPASASAAPESYEAFNLPEGFALDGERLAAATEFFKAKGYSQAEAQEAIDLFTHLAIEDVGNVLSKLAAGDTATADALIDRRAAALASKAEEATQAEFGDRAEEMLEQARGVLQSYEGLRPNLINKLTDPLRGWGKDPDMLFVLADLAQYLPADPSAPAGANGEGTLAQRMYPNT